MSARTALSPLRTARAEQVARLIADYGHGMALTEEAYRAARSFNGLTRSQLDTALDDLVAADRIELVNSGGVVVARLVKEVSE
jgi:hypothetical protein